MGLELHHTPVMAPEVLDALAVRPGGRYIDATLGEGGHAEAILNAARPGGQVLGIDADREAILVARERLAGYAPDFVTARVNFRELRAVALALDFAPVHGVLFDLGVSSLQLDAEARGFSFRRADPLDMRFDLSQELTASHIVNAYSREQLANLIYEYGEERASRRIAGAIVAARPIANAAELAEVVARASGGRRGRIHPATRTFQAIRIAVNDELAALRTALEQAVSLLEPGGRLAVISYHSLEDRIVKGFIRRAASSCICPPETPVCACSHRPTVSQVNRRVIRPSQNEVHSNVRSRSAKLRVAERI